jgi:GNAT superfamily N-acetyltransferase
MPIRDANPQDIDTVGALIKALAEYEHLAHEVQWTTDALAAQLFSPHSTTKVLLIEDPDTADIAGFALWYPTFSTFLGRHGIWLEDLFVHPEHRGKGYGLALLQHLRTLTDGRVEWMVLDWNEASIKFYDALGAAPVGGWTRYRWLAGASTPTGSLASNQTSNQASNQT